MTPGPDHPTDPCGPGASPPEQLLLAVLDRSPDAVLVMDGESLELAYVTEATVGLTGYSRHEVVGMTPDQLFATSDLGALRERARSLADADVLTVQRPLRRADGAWVDCVVRLRPLRVGPSRWVAAYCRDVDERHEADAERDRLDRSFLLVREQERIARDLHDTVIQSLFGIGMSLQATAALAIEDRTRHRVQDAVENIDLAIRDLRATVFSLSQPPAVSSGLREQVTSIAYDICRSLGFAPTVEFAGPVDLAVADEVHRQLIPCLRESLSNVARHAGARRVDICLRVEEEVVLEVSDDGRGIAEGAPRGHGLRNLERRAQLLGGHCRFSPRDGGGTVMQWRVPADSSGAGAPG